MDDSDLVSVAREFRQGMADRHPFHVATLVMLTATNAKYGAMTIWAKDAANAEYSARAILRRDFPCAMSIDVTASLYSMDELRSLTVYAGALGLG